jgi:hypothetical protein
MILSGLRGSDAESRLAFRVSKATVSQNSIVGPNLARDWNDARHTVNPVWIRRNSGDNMQFRRASREKMRGGDVEDIVIRGIAS